MSALFDWIDALPDLHFLLLVGAIYAGMALTVFLIDLRRG